MKNYFISLAGDVGSDGLTACKEALAEKVEDLTNAGFQIKLMNQNNDIAIVEADDMAIATLQSEWFVLSIFEDAQFSPMQ